MLGWDIFASMSMNEALRELDDEISSIDELLASLTQEQWDAPTPSELWTVKDQVCHLADTNEVAIDTMLAGPRSLNEDVKRFSSPEEFTQWGVDRGRGMSGPEVLEWWRATCKQMRDTFLSLDPKQRVPWGLGMQARTLVTARLMEHWAHASDVRRAVDAPIELVPRMRSIAWLILNAIPYAFSFAQIEPPKDRTLRIELAAGPEIWRIGPDDATDVIRGDAVTFCLVGVQRMDGAGSGLEADGPLAEIALENLRAFL